MSSIDVRASGNDLELWHVQVGGIVQTMSLDELDNAFQSGTIDERTMVLKAGALHWTTLGDIAGIEEQPNSIAPMATDLVSSELVIPPLDSPNFDVSFGTEELAVFKPKRRVGRALAVFALVAAVGGGLFAAKSYGTDNLRAKVASITSLVKEGGGESARAAAAAPIAEAPKAAAPPPPAMNLPPARTAAVSIDSLPPASTAAMPSDKNGKKKATQTAPQKQPKAAPAKAKSSGKSSDPTQKGSGQFDPLNGSL